MGHMGEGLPGFSTSLSSSAGGAKGCSDHSFRAPLAYIAQLLTYPSNNNIMLEKIKNPKNPFYPPKKSARAGFSG